MTLKRPRAPVEAPLPRWRHWVSPTLRALLLIFGLAPFFVWLLAHFPSAYRLAAPFEAWFHFQCHQEMGRSAKLLGVFLPVCNRCLGIYFGLALGALIARPELSSKALRIWVAGAAALMLIDVFSESYGLRTEISWLRFASGVLLAYPVSCTLVHSFRVEPKAPASPKQTL